MAVASFLIALKGCIADESVNVPNETNEIHIHNYSSDNHIKIENNDNKVDIYIKDKVHQNDELNKQEKGDDWFSGGERT